MTRNRFEQQRAKRNFDIRREKDRQENEFKSAAASEPFQRQR